MNQALRVEVTQAVIDQLAEERRPSMDQALHLWWQNFSRSGGLRLTQAGYEAFTEVTQSWCFDMPLGFLTKPAHLLILDKKITCPYFLRLGKHPQIIVFGSKTAMMLALYQDPEKWVAFLQHN